MAGPTLNPDYAQLRHTMVDTQLRTVGVNDAAVLAAMSKVPRERFVPADRAGLAYADGAVQLGGGRTLAEPLVTGLLLTHLKVQPGERVLIVGAGSGYSAALLVEIGAEVTALEEQPDLRAMAEAAGVAAAGGALAEGCPDGAPYDAMLIESAVETLPPALLTQLVEGGRLAAVMLDEGGVARATIGRVMGGRFTGTAFLEVAAARLPGFERPKAFVF